MIGFLPILALIYLLRPFRRIQVWHLPAENMGALSADLDLFSRRYKARALPKNKIWLLFASVAINPTFLRMWHRAFPFVESRFLARIYFLLRPLLERTGVCDVNYFHSWDYLEANIYSPPLFFTVEEIEHGRKALAKMGVGEKDWFVPFHVREESYFLKVMPKEHLEYHQRAGFPTRHRDANIANYLPAAELIAERGGYAIRTGVHVAFPLPTSNPRIVDYASRFRSEFMDIYLFGNARFFLCSETGVLYTPSIFNVPCACANTAHLAMPPLRPTDLYIYKMWRRKGEDRPLTFPELRETPLFDYHSFRGGKKNIPVVELGLEAIENAPEDILDLCRDMLDQLDGIAPSAEARELQQIWRRRYMRHLDSIPHSEYAGWIGPRFVLKHRHLIEP